MNLGSTPPPPPDSAVPAVRVVAKPNGPLLVQGGVPIIDLDGNVLKVAPVVALCRCGQSGAKPFCDGTHGRVGWRSA